jgi:hypothetical protein
VEAQQLEMWFLGFPRSAIGVSERRIALGVHATVSTVLRKLRTELRKYADETSRGREPVGFCRQSRFRADDRSLESPDGSVRTRFAGVRDCSLMSFNANISRYA